LEYLRLLWKNFSQEAIYLKNRFWRLGICGFCAGAVNGLFGAAGGMILVPLLTALTDLEDSEIFTASIAIILPVCIVSLVMRFFSGTVDIMAALPYLFGSAAGGLLAGKYGQKLSVTWLHRALGIMILWGGIRYLC